MIVNLPPRQKEGRHTFSTCPPTVGNTAVRAALRINERNGDQIKLLMTLQDKGGHRTISARVTKGLVSDKE